MSSEELLFVFSTVPDQDTASRLAKALIESQLAACVSILPGISSVYRWEGKIESTSELLLVIKTSRSGYPALEAKITELHPYEVPEIVALPSCNVSAKYLQWVLGEVRRD